MNISPARTAAFAILMRIETERAFSSILLPEHEQNLSPKDRSLCHQIVLGVLRKQMPLDLAIDHFAGGRKIDVEVRISLRIGLYQLSFLDKIPAHSAVNESVNLVVNAKKKSARGFVNAVLRKSVREPFEPRYEDDIECLSVESSHPRWLIERWIAEFGIEEASALAHANNAIPIIAFRLTGLADVGRNFAAAAPSKFVPLCLTADAFTAEMLEATSRGEIYIQDEGSQLVGNAVKLSDSGRFIDVCAAPGSKITQIAARDAALNVSFVAGDVHAQRTRFLRENCQAQGLPDINVVRYNAELELPFAERSFDTVLVDAPCSGTGTIRHNPEIRYFLEPTAFDQLSGKQLTILRHASKLVKSGGTLIYSTCSLEREENENVAELFLGQSEDFLVDRPNVPERFIGPDNFARTLPHRDQMDGFFISVFRRR